MSLRKIAAVLKEQYNLEVSQNIVNRTLGSLGYSKQRNQKSLQVGEAHPSRNDQFEFINNTVKVFIEQGEPVTSSVKTLKDYLR